MLFCIYQLTVIHLRNKARICDIAKLAKYGLDPLKQEEVVPKRERTGPRLLI